MSSLNIIQNALISVSNKSNIIEIAKILINNKINLFSTGGTKKIFDQYNIPVTSVSNYTQFPEIMDGRVKTLHHKIMAGILGRRKKDQKIMHLHNIIPIDIVIVNFYPFPEKNQENSKNIDNFINNIDIGGPTLVRAAAKNYKDVIIITDLLDFQLIMNDINQNIINLEHRFHLACKAFKYTSLYEKKIEKYFNKYDVFNKKNKKNIFPENLNINFIKKQNLRYGENPHQKACLYVEENKSLSGTISGSYQIQGKLLSYNNISDSDIALECVKEFQYPACVIVKHGNPCGVAMSKSLYTSYLSAYHADSISAFGGVIAFNDKLDTLTLETIIHNQFVEIIIATDIEESAIKILKNKKNIRVLITGKHKYTKDGIDFKRINNGLIAQEYDIYDTTLDTWNFVTHRLPTSDELKDSIFCWKVAKFIKSNAIVYGKNNITLSIGAGQTSRIDSIKIANMKIKEKNKNIIGATMSSDAFFPFRDGIDDAASMGISCIIQPGGSIRDKEVIEAANQKNITMIFTKIRHFKH
ncbi:bifunctional phosphoribosylaminoimidazolecarboxamide formyltransferase/IMP cyclohydrolase [Buchnera aphidicola]|uniref:bifunctional phosphoribosylaminoimidazolecarboxamide formyltransferase/IMP cyclohydrolase n=1 Tax=Buchnera aphidicola TaxID=9 RepID=UPI003BEEB8AF